MYGCIFSGSSLRFKLNFCDKYSNLFRWESTPPLPQPSQIKLSSSTPRPQFQMESTTVFFRHPPPPPPARSPSGCSDGVTSLHTRWRRVTLSGKAVPRPFQMESPSALNPAFFGWSHPPPPSPPSLFFPLTTTNILSCIECFYFKT